MLNREIRISLYVKKLFGMKKKKEWWNKTLTYFAGYLEIYDMSSCHRSYFASMIQSVTGVFDKTFGSISALSPSVGGSFSRPAAYNRA